jgi:hypothetical protein
MGRGLRDRWRFGVAVSVALAAFGASTGASAYQLKQTHSGKDVRFAAPSVELVISSKADDEVHGAADAVAAAASTWSGVAGAPTLSTTVGSTPSKPAVDGRNTVIFSSSYAPVQSALAVTVVTFDDATGAIVDADVVVNARRSFAVLSPSSRAPDDSNFVSTEGSSSGDHGEVFDLTHVIVHELGHTLGLSDETANAAAAMFPYTKPGDASVRAPGSDDTTGIAALYGHAPAGGAAAAGCGGGASVSGRTGAGVPAVALLLGALAACGLARRRRALLLPCFFVVTGLAARPAAADGPGSPADATMTVALATTHLADGVFETTLELAPKTCARSACPVLAEATVWGGTVGGLTQQVGEQRTPRVGDDVDVVFAASSVASERPAAVVIGLAARGAGGF